MQARSTVDGPAAAQVAGGKGPAGLKRLAFDVASSLLLLAVYFTTGNIYVAMGAGLVAGLAQVTWLKARGQSVDPMQWMSLGLVVVLGAATALTHDPTFLVFKPSIFLACIGVMMLRPGWAARYAPAYARDLVPRWLMVVWGYVWAAVMFALAASNLFVERLYGLKVWAVYTSVAPWVAIGLLMGAGLLIFPPIVRRNARARGIDLRAARAAASTSV